MSATQFDLDGIAFAWQREDLVEDERGRKFPAVVRYGPYLFVSGSDGYRGLDEKIYPELAENAVQQCRNSYGRVARRLERAGYGGDCAIWIENFTSGQHWRLERLSTWPEFFGEQNHMQAVAFGVQSRHNGINMITSTVMAIDPRIARHVAVPAPGRGRASRITRAGDLVFVIGVRGHAGADGAHAPEETADAFDIQFDYCMQGLQSHLSKAGTSLNNFVRMDAGLRAARFVAPYEANVRRYFDGKIPFAHYAVGTPLGARCEQEIGGIATAAGVASSITWSTADPSVADASTAAGLVFVRNVSGMLDEATGSLLPSLHGDAKGQVKQAVQNLARILARANTSPEKLLRLDVFIRDIYAETDITDELVRVLGPCMPATTFIGSEPRHGAEIELTAVAGAL